jgi:hypothetical protein
MPIFEVIIEFIGQILLEFILYGILTVPGAFFRFLISRLWRSKRTFKDYLKDDMVMNGTVGLFLLVAIGLIITIAA